MRRFALGRSAEEEFLDSGDDSEAVAQPLGPPEHEGLDGLVLRGRLPRVQPRLGLHAHHRDSDKEEKLKHNIKKV